MSDGDRKSNLGESADGTSQRNMSEYLSLERKKKKAHFDQALQNVQQSLQPLPQNTRVSQAKILENAISFIEYMKQKAIFKQQEIDEIKTQNALLALQLESANANMCSEDDGDEDDDYSSCSSSSESDEHIIL